MYTKKHSSQCTTTHWLSLPEFQDPLKKVQRQRGQDGKKEKEGKGENRCLKIIQWGSCFGSKQSLLCVNWLSASIGIMKIFMQRNWKKEVYFLFCFFPFHALPLNFMNVHLSTLLPRSFFRMVHNNSCLAGCFDSLDFNLRRWNSFKLFFWFYHDIRWHQTL